MCSGLRDMINALGIDYPRFSQLRQSFEQGRGAAYPSDISFVGCSQDHNRGMLCVKSVLDCASELSYKIDHVENVDGPDLCNGRKPDFSVCLHGDLKAIVEVETSDSCNLPETIRQLSDLVSFSSENEVIFVIVTPRDSIDCLKSSLRGVGIIIDNIYFDSY